MPSRIYSEDLVLNLIINGKDMPAQNKTALNELYKLDRETRDLEIALAKVRLEQKKLGKETEANSKRFKQLTRDAAKLTKQIEQNHAAMNQLRQDIGRTGLTINQLNSHLKVLKIQLNNATDPRIMARLRKEIVLTENRIKHLVTGASRLSIAFERLGTIANKFGTITSWVAILGYAFARAVGGTVKTLRELDKQFSNVMKSTDLTRQEMWALKQQFDQLNMDEAMRTPTKTADLMEIARIAGRLGVRGVKDIADFTMAVDKLYVALGEDLQGNIEDVAEKIGKLVTTFRLTDEMPLGEAMLRAGSLINELSKSSAAGAETILNYTSRLGGVGSMAKFSMDQLAGLGAALDAVGVPAERGSTALAKLITGMGEHAEKFARALGMSIDEYRTSMETNINETMLKLAEASATGNASIMDVVEGMDRMDVTGVRVMEVYGKLVQNMDLVIQQQDIAARAFQSSASVMNEFYIMSKDFDSLMALQGKRWKALSDSYAKSVAPSVYKLYRGFTDVAYAMKDVVQWIGKHINIFKALIAMWIALKSLSIAKLIHSIAVSIKVLTIELYKNIKAAILNNATIKSMWVAYGYAEGGIKGLTAALKVLWGVMIKNPVTAIIAVAGALAAAFFLLKIRTTEFAKANGKLVASIQTEVGAMNFLFSAIEKTNEGSEERRVLMTKMNETYGQYLPYLLTEKDSLDAITTARNFANAALKEEIALRIQSEYLNEANLKAQDKIIKNTKKLFPETRLGKKIEPQMLATAMTEFNVLQDKLIDSYILTEKFDQAAIRSYIKKYENIITDANDMTGEIAGARIEAVIKANATIKKELDANSKFVNQFISESKKKANEIRAAGGFTGIIMTEGEYKEKLENAQIAFDNELKLLQEKRIKGIVTEEAYNKELTRIELTHLNKQLEIEKLHWTRRIKVNKDGQEQFVEEMIPGYHKEIVDLETKIREKQIELLSAGGRKSEVKEKEIKEIDIAKLRAKTIKDEHEKELEEEKVRYTNALKDYELTEDEKIIYTKKSSDEREKIDKNRREAAETEEEIHKRNLNEIHLKYLDKQLADDNVTFAKKMILLEAELQQQQITEEEYAIRRKELTEEHEENILAYKRRYGVLVEETLNDEIEMFQKSEYYALLTEEEKQKGIEAIRQKYNEKRERTFKSNIEAEFDAIKQGFNELQMQTLAQGESVLTIWEQVSSGIGDAFASLFDNSQKGFSAFAKQIVLMSLDLAAQLARAQYPIILAKNIAKYALLPGGQAIALSKTAQSVILIEAAFAAAKGLVSALWKTEKTKETTQFAKGSYPVEAIKNFRKGIGQYAGGSYAVTGADDGRSYNAKYVGPVTTGIYRKPSLGLFAEKPEMVIDYPTLRRIQYNSPRLIDAILAHRTSPQPSPKGDGVIGQYAKGSYPVDAGMTITDPEMKEVMEKLVVSVNKLLVWKPTVYSELIKKDLETLDSINARRGL